MLFVLNAIKRRLLRWRTGMPAVLVMVFVFFTSWPLMALAEPPESNIAAPENYWWWFIVSGSTVGYGDQFPVSLGGRLVGVYVIIGAITALSSLFAQLAQVIEKKKGRRMHGAITVSHSGHIVILGYTPDRTERIVRGLSRDGGSRIVVCGQGNVVNPFTDGGADFVRGELADPELLQQAGVHRAQSVLVDARDDNEALAQAVSVNHVNPDLHLVVTLRDLARADHLTFVNDTVRCVQWHMPRMATEELQDPGITQVYAELMTQGGGNTYSLRLPAAIGDQDFGACQATLGQEFGATVLAVRSGDQLTVSPDWNTAIQPGSTIYYVNQRRLADQEIVTAFGGRGARRSRVPSATEATAP